MVISPTLLKEIAARLGADNVLTDEADLFVHGFDATATPRLPEVVVIPKYVDDLAWACERLWTAGVPTTPRGAGTGFSGGAVPARGGAVVVCDRLKNIGEVEESVVAVEPGVVADDLNRALKRLGLFYPVDPASSEASTIGGHVAENAGGPRAFKYGVTRDYVQRLEMISPGRGREIYADGVGGPDVLSVLVGSEGTLGVWLSISLRVRPFPGATAAVIAHFGGTAAAAAAAGGILGSAVVPAKLEFLDHSCMRAVNARDAGTFEEEAAAVLMVEVDGGAAAVPEDVNVLRRVFENAGARGVIVAVGEEEVARLWRARRGVSPALGILAPHKKNEDVCVPRSQIPALLAYIGELEREYGLVIPTFGHIGDGNLHVNFMYDWRVRGMATRVARGVSDLMARVVALGGTISGEHGVGLTKARYLGGEQSAAEYGWAARVKAYFDPAGVLNPGKIFAVETGEET